MPEISQGVASETDGCMTLGAFRFSVRPGSLGRQVPAFAAIGAMGYVLVRYAGLNPLVARLPAFAVATVFNFVLNRLITFSDTSAPLLRAFLRYVVVCAAGLVVNYVVYALALAVASAAGIPTPPSTLPIFVAFGSGAAMFVTFFGFRFFAFRG